MDNETKQAPEKGGLASLILTIVGFALFLIVLAFMWLDRGTETVVRSNRAPEERLGILREHREKEQEELNSYGWIDRNQGVVRLPVERAMELALEEMNQGN